MSQFTRGQFVKYRASCKLHLGQLSEDLFENQEVEFDGTVLRVESEEYTLPALRGAVEKNWLVPVGSGDGIEYVAKASDVLVRPAVVSDPRTKPDRKMTMTVSQDEREVGSLSQFQDRKAKAESTVEGVSNVKAFTAAEGGNVGMDTVPVTSGAPVGNVGINSIEESASPVRRADMSLVSEEESVVVSSGGFSSSTKSSPTIKDSVDDLEVRRTASVQAEVFDDFDWKKGSFFGFLVTRKFGSGVTDGYLEEDEYLEFDGWTVRYEGQEFTGPDAIKFRKAYEAGLITLYSSEVDEPVVEASASSESFDDGITLPNGDQWDMSVHWRTRGKLAIEKYAQSPEVLDAIVAVEKPGVVKVIESSR